MADMQMMLVLRANTEEARAKLQAAAREVKELGGEVKQVSASGGKPLRDVSEGSELAAGSVANLTAQFNDIGVMLAAGQSPLQLALQQGTQVAQVIGPMGAAGAVKALGAAFLSLLNPVTLVTVGGIAAGAAFTQWLTSADEASEELEKRLKSLNDQVKAFEEANKSASRTSLEMAEEYGALAASAAEVLEINRRLTELRAQEGLSATARNLADELGLDGVLDLSPEELADIDGAIAALRAERQQIDASIASASDAEFAQANRRVEEIVERVSALKAVASGLPDLADVFGIGEDEALEVATRFAAIGEAEGPRQQAEVMISLAQYISDVSDGLARAEEEGEALYEQLVEAALAALNLARVQAADQITADNLIASLTRQNAISAAIAENGKDSAEVEALRLGYARELFQAKLDALNVPEEERARARALWEQQQADKAAARQANDQAAAEDEIAKLENERAIKEAILQHGEGSVEVAELRLKAERESYKTKVDARNIEQDLKDEMMATWDAANGIASVDLAGNITLAADEASRLATNAHNAMVSLMQARGAAMMGRVRENPDFHDPRGESPGSGNADYVYTPFSLPPVVLPPNPRSSRRSSGSGGRGRATKGFADLQAEAQSILAELDVAVAAINEKVRAGLLSTAEGTRAIAEAKDQAAGEIADLIPKLDAAAEAAGPKGAAAVAQWREELKKLAKDLDDARENLSQSLSDTFADGLGDVLSQTQDASDAVGDMVDAIQRHIARLVTDRFTSAFITPLIDSLLSFLPFVAGGVPKGANLADHRDTVGDTPIFFGMGPGKIGVAREAGKEAILPVRPAGGADGILAVGPNGEQGTVPLTRTPSGALGVRLLERPDFFAMGGIVGGAPALATPAAGGGGKAGGSNVQVNVHNNGGGEARVEERQEGNMRIIDVLIERVEAGIASNIGRNVGPLSDVLGGAYGLRRAPR